MENGKKKENNFQGHTVNCPPQKSVRIKLIHSIYDKEFKVWRKDSDI